MLDGNLKDIRQMHALRRAQGFLDHVGECSSRAPEDTAARMKCLAGNPQVLGNREVFQQHVALKRSRNPGTCYFLRTTGDRLSVNKHISTGWTQPTSDQIDKRRLTGAIRADHGAALPRRHRQIEVRDNLEPAKRFVQVSGLKRTHGLLHKADFNASTTPLRKNATTSMKKMPKNIMYSVVRMLSPCFARTKAAAPTSGPTTEVVPPIMTIRTPSPLNCQLMESGLMKWYIEPEGCRRRHK